MSKTFYQTTKVVTVTENNKVVVRAPGVIGPKGDPGTSVLTGPGIPSNLIGNIGDLYVDTNTKNVYGPKTVNGWDLTQVLFQGFHSELLGKTFTIGSPSDTWELNHNLGYNPNVTAVDSSGSIIEGEISYPDENTIVLRFIGANTGKVYLS